MNYKFNYSSSINKNGDTATIHIYGVIGIDDSMFDEGTNNTAFKLNSLIKRLDKEVKRINIHINSPGGIIDEGLAIYNTIKNLTNAEVHTYNDGLVASMASIILLAGKTHFPKASLFHLHNALTMAIGNQHDFKKEADNLAKFDEVIQEALIEKTNKSREEIKNYFNGDDHFFSANDANTLGVVDVFEETKANPPKSPENIKKMSANQLFNLYTEEPKNSSNWINKLKNQVFPKYQQESNPTTNKKSKSMTQFKSASHVNTALGAESLQLDENNQIGLTVDQVMSLDAKIQREQANAQSEKQAREAAEQKVQELENRLNQEPASEPTQPKGQDPTTDEDTKPIDPEIRRQMLSEDT